MNTKTILEIVTVAFAVSLVAAQSVGNVFAEDNQKSSQINNCGNGNNPTNVFCQNINPQLLGHDNDGSVIPKQCDLSALC
jgi:hypothetical protein